MDEKSNLSPFQQPIFLPPPSPPLRGGGGGGGFSLNNMVSPSILLIIIILAIIFFISGLLHLLVRYLLRPSRRDPDELENVTALQGQLQQLFHLHDSGVDQSFIDTLPIFNYKAIIGLKNQNHFDCAVCLCEFEAEDNLRLLPKCSHAFHMECIDTWLLSHSTCPLCRASLLPDYSSMASTPIVLVLESGSESSREIVHPEREGILGNSHSDNDDLAKSCEIQEKEEGNQEKVVKVKLGKFRNNVDCGGESSSNSYNNSEIDSRRCFSMGSFAYIMDDNTSLLVPIRMKKKQASKKPVLPLTPGHRLALSECGCDSRRDFNGFEAFKFSEIQTSSVIGSDNEININKVVKDGKRESFSVSKIWLRGKKDHNNRPNPAADGSSRRAVSFRLPDGAGHKAQSGGGGGGGSGGASVSGIGIDVENDGSNNIVNSQENAPSFGRRTLIWLMGRQNKVVHSTFSSNV